MRRFKVLTLSLLLVCHNASSEPTLENHLQVKNIDLLRRADISWITQAFQTQCDNINYNDFTDCCTKKSGSGWRSCNNVDTWMLGGSTILCYNLDAGHDCCNDNSVCDTNLGCCGDSCCQNSSSVTVCGNGCVTKDGLGCVAGENGAKGDCKHGISNGSGTTSTADASTPTSVDVGSSSTSTSDQSIQPITSSSTNTSAPEKSSLSSGGIIGIAVSVGCSVISLVWGIGFGINKYQRKQQQLQQEKLEKQRKEDEAPNQGAAGGKLRSNSAPASPAPWHSPYSDPIDRDFSPTSGDYSSNAGYYGR